MEEAGTATKKPIHETASGEESWFIPHHMVQHNGKRRIVFDCSFQYKGLSLNESLLPGPTLSPSLLGVLLRFREHSVGISGDIRAMFHQVLLLPEDKPFLRFIWRNIQREELPQVYEWQGPPAALVVPPMHSSTTLLVIAQLRVKSASLSRDASTLTTVYRVCHLPKKQSSWLMISDASLPLEDSTSVSGPAISRMSYSTCLQKSGQAS